jgi:hypothetical protein
MDQLMLPEIHLGRPQGLGPLTVFPLWTAVPPFTDLMTAGDIQIGVTELPQPDYTRVVISNPGSTPVLVLEGELLVGGMQHRILAGDVVVAPKSSVTVPVMCVERGRWDGDRRHAHTNDRVALSIRAAVTGAEETAAQSEVWNRVSHLEGLYGSSATSSYLDVEAAAVNLPPVSYQPLPGQQGVLVGAAGYPAIVELFPSTRDIRRSIEALLRSVMLEAVRLPGDAKSVPGRRARRMVGHLEAMTLCEARDRESGLATPLASYNEKVMVRATDYHGALAHVVAFDRRHPLVRV